MEAVSVILVDALARQTGFDVHVVTAERDRSTIATLQHGPVTVHRLPWSATRILTGALGREGRRLRDYIGSLQCDLVHAHDTYGIMLRGLDVPRVLTIHGFIHEDTRVSGERWARLRGRVWRRIETRAWADYPHVISISPYVRERLRGIVSGVVHDIENPIDEAFFDVQRRDNGRDIFCAATLSPRKNTLGLVEAFGRLKARGIDASLTLAGAQVPAYAARVHQRIAELSLQRSVTVLPSIPVREVCDKLASASVVALVSLEENAPLAIEEAMAAGVPVVTSNRCGMPYLVSEGETGYLVNPHNPDEIADRLARILAHPALRVRMGTRARTAARDRFHPLAVAHRTRQVYLRAARAHSTADIAGDVGPASGAREDIDDGFQDFVRQQ